MFVALKNEYLGWMKKCDEISSQNYFTNAYGMARSLFALCTLFNLAFNSKYTLFNETNFGGATRQDYSSLNFFLLFNYDNLIYAQIVGIVILLIVISGFYPRYTGILHWWVTFSYFHLTNVADGGDQIASNVTFLLIFITLLDTRKNHWIPSAKSNLYKNFFAALIFTLISIQVAVIYLHSAIHKLYHVDEWIDGTAIYYWFNNTIFGLNSFTKEIIYPILDFPLAIYLLNWGVIVFEILLFCALLSSRKVKLRFFYIGIIFHLSIALLLGLVSFFMSMSACLMLYLYPKDINLSFFFHNKNTAINRETTNR